MADDKWIVHHKFWVVPPPFGELNIHKESDESAEMVSIKGGMDAIDWRSRALIAEARVKELQALLHQIGAP